MVYTATATISEEKEIPEYLSPYANLTSEIIAMPWRYLPTQRAIPETSELREEFSMDVYGLPIPYLISFMITTIMALICLGSIYLSIKKGIMLLGPFYCFFGMFALIGLSITSLIGIFRWKQ